MRSHVALVALCLLAAVATSVTAQDTTLAVPTTAQKPVVDGAVTAGEYGTTLQIAKGQLSVSRTQDTLTLSFAAPTTGWVAIGLGSNRMDQSAMFIGYVSNGKLELKTQIGRGHSHSEAATEALVSSAAKEANGHTTLEISLKSSAILAAGQRQLPVIVAFGTADSFVSMHASRGSVTLTFTN